MKVYFKAIFLVFYVAVCIAVAETPPEPYFGLTPPGLTPEVFAPGRISIPNSFEQDICFSEDTGECYFTIRNASWSDRRIYETHYESGQWTPIAQASFSNNKSLVPSLADNDQNMYFNMNAGTWKATRSGGGWSSPVKVGAPVGSSYDDWSCHISDLGNAWICSWRPGGMGQCDLWKVQYEDGNFTVAVPLNTLNTTYSDCQPVPGPDEEYIIYNASRPGGYGGMDLYISFADGWGGWTAPQNAGPTINTSGDDVSPYISPDNKYLFFSRQLSSTDSDIYWVDIHALCHAGDFSCDGRVDFEDVEMLSACWLADEPSMDMAPPGAPDGIINSREFNLVAENWMYEIPDTVPPLAPTGLVAAAGDSTVSLDWNNNNSELDFEGYNVYRSQTIGAGFTRLNGSLWIDSNYTDNTVIDGTVYFYAVTAVDASGNESVYSNKVSAIPLAPGSIIIQENTAGFCNTNGIITAMYAGFTGTGFCYAPYSLGKYINWSINVPSSGIYTFTWRYAFVVSTPAKLLVNSVEVIPLVTFPDTGGWTIWSSVSVDVSLTAGLNRIRLEATTTSGLANIDYIMITGDNPQPASCL
jgi:hypothetical protein